MGSLLREPGWLQLDKSVAESNKVWPEKNDAHVASAPAGMVALKACALAKVGTLMGKDVFNDDLKLYYLR